MISRQNQGMPERTAQTPRKLVNRGNEFVFIATSLFSSSSTDFMCHITSLKITPKRKLLESSTHWHGGNLDLIFAQGPDLQIYQQITSLYPTVTTTSPGSHSIAHALLPPRQHTSKCPNTPRGTLLQLKPCVVCLIYTCRPIYKFDEISERSLHFACYWTQA
jgi:hypothetical protein